MTPRGGAAPQAEGQTFEELLDWIHKGYLARGRAAIYHNKVAGKFIGQGQFIPDPALARPDYSGTLASNVMNPFGISVHFDGKTMNDTCGWTLPGDRKHQYEELLEQARMGAIAFFLVECRAAQAVYLLRVHPSIPVEDNRPKIMFADAPVANGQLEAKFDRRHKHQISAIPLICVERTVDGTYDWLTAVEHFWLSWSTLPPRPVGRPAMNTERDEQICKLGKTHSNKELARDFHLAASGIAKIKRDHKASSAAKIA